MITSKLRELLRQAANLRATYRYNSDSRGFDESAHFIRVDENAQAINDELNRIDEQYELMPEYYDETA